MRSLCLLLLALAVGGVPRPLVAQIGTTTEIITGRVTGPDSAPVAGARVEVTSVATGVKRLTGTRNDGRYTLLFREGGAQFRVTITALGMRPATFALNRRGDEDRLVADVRMSASATTLAQVQVRARNSRPGSAPASAAGATEALIPPGYLARFPVTPGDLNAAATLVPGVVAVAGGDSASGGISVGGQPANQNNLTLDGSSFLFGSVPQNSVRTVRVVTNAYDPARGQFTGGQVATTTIAGTSRTVGTATLNALPRQLQRPIVPTRTFDQRFTQGNAGVGIGGPLVKDKAFYFAALDVDQRQEPVASLLDVTPAIAGNLGLAADSLTRFLAFADRSGLSRRNDAPDARVTSALSSLVRVDWDLSPTTALMVRADYRANTLNIARAGSLALPSIAGTSASSGGGVLTSLTASLGSFINEFRAYTSRDRQAVSLDRPMPLGIVNVTSQLDSGRTGQAQLLFGGSASLPRTVTSHLTEVSNEVSRLVGGGHRVKLGLLINAQRSEIDGIGNQQGTFLFNTLTDLHENRPALFARALGRNAQQAGTTTGGVYLADAWRVSPSLQIVYGTRLEATRMSGLPAANRAVAQAFDARTEVWPTDVRVTPRVGFTYLLGNVAGIPAGTIKGGVGLFRGTIPTGLVTAVANGSGLPGAQQQVICTGGDVPVPDWSTLSAGAAAPERCLSERPVGIGPSTRPTVLLFDRTFGAPEVWRASLGYTRQFALRWAVAADVVYSHGTRSPLAVDRNLGVAGLALAEEGGRPVFAAPGEIVAATGATTGNGTRPQTAFGPVLAIGSGTQSRATQATLTLAGPSFRGGGTSVSYTWNRVRDISNGFGLGSALPTTDGDPNRLEWGPGDLERRHQVVAQQITNFPHGLELTFVGRLLSGARYTPMVNGDVNGDGARNDRAYVPRTDGNEALSAAMRALLLSTDARAATCLRAQAGRVASRNSCTTPWTPQLDVQLNWRPRARRFDDRLTVSLLAANTLAGVDRLLHGTAIKGWGQPLFPDRQLLTVTGFDAASRRYRYTVNERFGTPTATRNPLGVPFQLSLRGQIAIGTDPSRANLRALSGNGGADSISVVRARVARQIPYPLDSLLRVADSLTLELTPAQRATITEANAQYRVAAEKGLDDIVALLTSNGGRPDLGAIAPKLQQANLVLVKAIQESLKTVERALTPAQWNRLPDRIRFPFGQQAPGV